MQPGFPQLCQYCGRRFPPGNAYRFCDLCGQPTASVAGPQVPVASPKPGVNLLVIAIVGLVLIIAIGVIIYLFSGLANKDASSTSDSSVSSVSTTMPNARILGTVVREPGTPPEVDYIVITIDNPAAGSPLPISKENFSIFYQDAANTERVSFPPTGGPSGFIVNADDKASIAGCSDLAKQPTYKAVWCLLNDGSGSSIAPGTSRDIYLFIGGLSVPLVGDSTFRIELDHLSANWSQTLMGQTPAHLEPILPRASQTPSTPAPTAEVESIPPTLPVQPGIIFNPPPGPQIQPTLPVQPGIIFNPPPGPQIQPTAAPVVQPTAAPAVQPTATATPRRLLPLPSRNVQQRPHVFVGKALKGASLVPVGTEISVWLEGYSAPVGESVTKVPARSGNNYVVEVYQYGTILNPSSSLSFHIGKQDTGQVSTWSQGGGTVLDLTIN